MRKAVIDLDWLDGYIEEREMVNNAVGGHLQNPVHILNIVKEKCIPITTETEQDVVYVVKAIKKFPPTTETDPR